jgi:hypothetical protein
MIINGKNYDLNQIAEALSKKELGIDGTDKIYESLFNLFDENNNGEWDTGDYSDKLQPEKVYYYPYDMELRAFWDVEEVWNVDELPILEQKPKELVKVWSKGKE